MKSKINKNKKVLTPQGKPWTLWVRTDKVGEVLNFLISALARKRKLIFFSLTSLDNKIVILFFLIAFFALTVFNFSQAQVANQINITAYIVSDKNQQVDDAEYDVRFALYRTDRNATDPYPSDSDAGQRVWQENQKIFIRDGVLSAYMGSVVPLPSDLNFYDNEYYLGIRVNGDSEFVPRKKIGSVPLAMDSAALQGATLGTAEGDILQLGKGGKIDTKMLATGNGKDQLVLGNDSRFDNIDDIHLQNTDNGTTELVFGVGTENPIAGNNFDFAVSNSSAKPALRFNGNANQWQYSNDGTVFTAMGATGNIDASQITTGTLGAQFGGTGINGYAVGDLLFANSTTTLGKLSVGANGQVLSVVGGMPVWADVPGASPLVETDPIFTASSAATIVGSNISNWNTAFGWGNHASQGYILDGNTNWDNSYGYITASSSETLTNKTWNGNAIDISSNTNLATSGNLLQISGDTLSIKQGSMNDAGICTYSTATGLDCTTLAGNVGATYVAGSGLNLIGSTFSLGGALTSDSTFSGAYDIALGNANSELKIMGSGGTYYGIFDIGNITGTDKTYTFPNASGTVALTTDIHAPIALSGQSYLSLVGQAITANQIDISSNTNLATSGNLLQISGDTLSIKEGTLTDTRICTYSTVAGLVCNTTTGSVGATYDSGSGIAQIGTTFSLGSALTSDATFTGAYDLVLGNSNSEIKIMGSGGTYYGILDTGAITATNKTYTFPDANGTVALTSSTTDGDLCTYDNTTKSIICNTSLSSVGGVALLSSAHSDINSLASSFSGLEFGGAGDDKLTLLQGCANGQVLKYDTGDNKWKCGDYVAGQTAIMNVNGTPNIDGITFASPEFSFGVNSGIANIGIDYANSKITRANQAETIANPWNFSDGIKILENGATPTYFGIFDVADLSGTDKTYTFPNASGTVALTTDIHAPITLSGQGYLSLFGQAITANQIDISSNTNLATSGNLLRISGDTLSIKEGSMNDAGICTYSTATGLDCTTLAGSVGVTYASGSGLNLIGSTFSLGGALTSDTTFSGAYDIALGNANSELKIMGSGGTYYGIFDIGNITGTDKTYTFPNASGTVALTTDIHAPMALSGQSYLSLVGQAITANQIDISSNTNLATSGNLLQISGDTLSVKQGSMNDAGICTYSTATGLDCTTLTGNVGATYVAGSGLNLVGTTFSVASNVMLETENISLLNNNVGYITGSSNETLTNKTWNGVAIGVGYGGTNATAIGASGTIAYSNSTVYAFSSVGTAGQAMISGGSGAPSWFSPTAGSLVFAGTNGILAQDNSNLFWDNTNKFLRLGATPYSMGVDTTDSSKFKIYPGSGVAGTGVFSIGTDGVTSIGSLNMGTQEFEQNSGIISWIDMPVTNGASINTVESYTSSMDGNPMITVYGKSDGAGSVTNLGVGIGNSSPSALLHVGSASSGGNVRIDNGWLCVDNNGTCSVATTAGTVYAVGIYTQGADYAEYFETKDADLVSGEAVCIDSEKENAIKRCQNSGDNNVMGIVSTNPSIVGNRNEKQDASPEKYKIIGMMGQVAGLVSSENGSVSIGDSLTSAATAGYLRKANAGESTVGIAMQNFADQKGTIQVLISRRNKSLTVEKVEEAVTANIASMNIADQVNAMVASAKTVLESQLSLNEIRLNSLESMTEKLEKQMTQIMAQEGNDLLLAKVDLNTQEISYLKTILGIDAKSQNGDIAIAGKLKAKIVETGKLVVFVDDLEARTIGNSAITAIKTDGNDDGNDDETGSDAKTIFVKTKAVNVTSKVFVTPKVALEQGIAVTDVKFGEGFTVSVKNAVTEDASFDWVIIEEK